MELTALEVWAECRMAAFLAGTARGPGQGAVQRRATNAAAAANLRSAVPSG